MATDLGSIISGVIPTKAGAVAGASNTFFWITILIIILLLLVGGGVAVFFIIRALQFNKKIDIYEERNGFVEYVGSDRAKELVYNSYGDSAFYLKKRKKYLPRGEIKVAKNRYIYIIRSDGEWVNAKLESFNNRLSEIGIKPIHPDMRAFKSGMGKLIKERYEKKSFFKEYAPILLPMIFFIIVSIALYFIVDRIVASEDNLLAMTVASKEVMDKASQVLSGVANVCSNSGIKPAGIILSLIGG